MLNINVTVYEMLTLGLEWISASSREVQVFLASWLQGRVEWGNIYVANLAAQLFAGKELNWKAKLLINGQTITFWSWDLGDQQRNKIDKWLKWISFK